MSADPIPPAATPAVPAAPPPVPRRRRWLRWLLLTLGGLALLGLIALPVIIVLLPWLTNQVIAREVKSLGLGQLHAEVLAITPNHVVVGPVVIGPAAHGVRVETIVLAYEPMGLWHKRLRYLRLYGVEAEAVQVDGQWQITGLSELLRLATTPPRAPAAPAAAPAPTPAAPTRDANQPVLPLLLEEFSIRSGQAKVHLGAQTLVVPFRLVVTAADQNHVQVLATLFPVGQEVEARANLSLRDGNGDVALAIPEFQLDRLAPLLAALLPPTVPRPTLQGTLQVRATATVTDWQPRATTLEVRGRGLGVSEAEFTAPLLGRLLGGTPHLADFRPGCALLSLTTLMLTARGEGDLPTLSWRGDVAVTVTGLVAGAGPKAEQRGALLVDLPAASALGHVELSARALRTELDLSCISPAIRGQDVHYRKTVALGASHLALHVTAHGGLGDQGAQLAAGVKARLLTGELRADDEPLAPRVSFAVEQFDGTLNGKLEPTMKLSLDGTAAVSAATGELRVTDRPAFVKATGRLRDARGTLTAQVAPGGALNGEVGLTVAALGAEVGGQALLVPLSLTASTQDVQGRAKVSLPRAGEYQIEATLSRGPAHAELVVLRGVQVITAAAQSASLQGKATVSGVPDQQDLAADATVGASSVAVTWAGQEWHAGLEQATAAAGVGLRRGQLAGLTTSGAVTNWRGSGPFGQVTLAALRWRHEGDLGLQTGTSQVNLALAGANGPDWQVEPWQAQLVRAARQITLTTEPLRVTAPGDVHATVALSGSGELGNDLRETRGQLAVGLSDVRAGAWHLAPATVSLSGSRAGAQLAVSSLASPQVPGVRLEEVAVVVTAPEEGAVAIGLSGQLLADVAPYRERVPALTALTGALAVALAGQVTLAPGQSPRFALSANAPPRPFALALGEVEAGAHVGIAGELTGSLDDFAAAGELRLDELTADYQRYHVGPGRVVGRGRLPGLSLARLRELAAAAMLDPRLLAKLLRVEGGVHAEIKELSGKGLNCEGLTVELPWTWDGAAGFVAGADGKPQGRIGAAVLQAYGLSFRPFVWPVRWQGQTVRFEGALAPEDGALSITFSPEVLLEPAGVTIRAPFDVRVPDLGKLSDFAGNLPGLDTLGPIELGGKARVSGEAGWGSRGVFGQTAVAVEAASARLSAKNMAVSGINLRLQLDQLWPPRTRPFQQLTFEHAEAAGFPVDGGDLRFQLADLESLMLEKGELKWCGGTLIAGAMPLNLKQPEIALTLFADHIQLGRLLPLLGFVGEGDGELFGKLPIEYSNGRINYHDGYLYSKPGRPGRIQAKSLGMLEDNPALAAIESTVHLKASLKDFTYDIFTVDFEGEGTKDARITLRLYGKSPLSPLPNPIDFKVKLQGPLAALVNAGLEMRRKNVDGGE